MRQGELRRRISSGTVLRTVVASLLVILVLVSTHAANSDDAKSVAAGPVADGSITDNPIPATDDGFSTADFSRVTTQHERLVALGEKFPDTAGVVKFDETNSQLIVRFKPGPSSGYYRAAVERSERADDEVPVVFEEASRSKAQLEMLRTSLSWAEPYQDDVVHVMVNNLDETVRIHAAAHLEELLSQATEYAGFEPEIVQVEHGEFVEDLVGSRDRLRFLEQNEPVMSVWFSS